MGTQSMRFPEAKMRRFNARERLTSDGCPTLSCQGRAQPTMCMLGIVATVA